MLAIFYKRGEIGSYTHFLVLACDAGAGIDQVDVVGEKRIARVLRDDTEGDENGQPPAVTLGLDKVHVAAIGVGIGFHSDGISHLSKLVLNRNIVSISAGVVISKCFQSLLIAFLGNQPTGT